MTLPPKQRDNITEALAERGVTLPCPRCGDSSWNVLDAYISNALTEDVRKVIVGGPVLPTIAVMCTRCGFLAEHVAAVLELFPNFGKDLRRGGEAVIMAASLVMAASLRV
jgi:hypothetical protein